MKVVDNDKIRDSQDVFAVDHLIKMKKEKPFWDVIAEIIKVWKKKNPKKWRSHIIEVKNIQDSRKVHTEGTSDFRGVSHDKETGGYLKYTLDIPGDIIFIIRALYTPEEAPMNKEFFRDFGKKFPVFKVMRKE